MGFIAVYRFTHPDEHLKGNGTAPRMATRESIQRVRGAVIETSEKLVNEADLDESGFYPRRPAKLPASGQLRARR
jgi:hypothetical protein